MWYNNPGYGIPYTVYRSPYTVFDGRRNTDDGRRYTVTQEWWKYAYSFADIIFSLDFFRTGVYVAQHYQ